MQPHQSPYNTFDNNPIYYSDPMGANSDPPNGGGGNEIEYGGGDNPLAGSGQGKSKGASSNRTEPGNSNQGKSKNAPSEKGNDDGGGSNAQGMAEFFGNAIGSGAGRAEQSALLVTSANNLTTESQTANPPIIPQRGTNDGGRIGWRDKSGRSFFKSELKDVEVYIFYDSRPNGEDGGFYDQTMAQYDYYVEKYGEGKVVLSEADTRWEFNSAWHGMQGDPKLIVMNLHGSDQALHLDIDFNGDGLLDDGEYIVSTNDGKTNGSITRGLRVCDLKEPQADLSKTELLLNTCNSARPSGKFKAGTSLAKAFSLYSGVLRVRASTTKVNFYTTGSRMAYPADGDNNPFNNSKSYFIYIENGRVMDKSWSEEKRKKFK